MDFPFGQPRRLIEAIAWPQSWAGYVSHIRSLGRAGFRALLDEYRAARPKGDKEHRRVTDIAAGSISPMKLFGTPVGLMFSEGAPHLLDLGVTIPGLQDGDTKRIAVEGYPACSPAALSATAPTSSTQRKSKRRINTSAKIDSTGRDQWRRAGNPRLSIGSPAPACR